MWPEQVNLHSGPAPEALRMRLPRTESPSLYAIRRHRKDAGSPFATTAQRLLPEVTVAAQPHEPDIEDTSNHRVAEWVTDPELETPEDAHVVLGNRSSLRPGARIDAAFLF